MTYRHFGCEPDPSTHLWRNKRVNVCTQSKREIEWMNGSAHMATCAYMQTITHTGCIRTHKHTSWHALAFINTLAHSCTLSNATYLSLCLSGHCCHILTNGLTNVFIWVYLTGNGTQQFISIPVSLGPGGNQQIQLLSTSNGQIIATNLASLQALTQPLNLGKGRLLQYLKDRSVWKKGCGELCGPPQVVLCRQLNNLQLYL